MFQVVTLDLCHRATFQNDVNYNDLGFCIQEI
uniref:Uncharacterized protein n=1 Tax=Arundo donax TaxID=35708 RepID=A0A0A9HR83_ARUDO